MNLTSCFKILGIDPDSDAAQAKRAYKAQVRRWHPDQFAEGTPTQAGAEEQLKQINIAYARVKKYLADKGPTPSEPRPTAAPQPEKRPADSTDGPPQATRSWVDHLFEAFNTAFGGRRPAPEGPAAKQTAARERKTFRQVLNEMAGGRVAPARRGRPKGRPGMRPMAAGYRRGSRRGSSVEGVGGPQDPGPVKPVGRVRGIGRRR